ncbi:iron ABC transporter permease [Halomonas urumqiensis]|uniref:Iron ABC transporter permease n=2 Tax=Halomonas urumqiensis TaxID=1684789 RepID=A0A2N7UKN3_9GAMM|nr:iron ABC transporter permease [Halomonas urumqiensis]PTB02950.1 iron ABC transporter permease [Halomonas urumqiensis]
MAIALCLGLAACERTPAPSSAPQGFAGLGAEGDGFAQAGPNQRLRFPEDHGPHPDTRIEWWYLTANLEDDEGQPLGLQWTLFRQALMPPTERPEPATWSADQVWMAHMAVSRGDTHRVAERFARGHSARVDGQAGAQAAPFRAWLDDWELSSRRSATHDESFGHLALSSFAPHEQGTFGFQLALDAEGPLVLHGESGFSQKAADGQGSMYYSQPFWRVSGDVTLDGETRRVTGRAWLDREWSSQLLGPDQRGWDWFSLHLADGHKLMAFQLRGGGEGGGDYRSGTWISPDGETRALAEDELALSALGESRVAGRDVPTRWRLEVPHAGLDVEVSAPYAERWMPTSVGYWEGEVVVHESDSGERVGEGYLEMTGY